MGGKRIQRTAEEQTLLKLDNDITQRRLLLLVVYDGAT